MSKPIERGDTIIEVVIAFAIFSLAAVGAIAIINTGLATTQRNLETTLVRQQIDSQAEILRNMRDTKDPAWQTLISSTTLVDNPAVLADSCKTVLPSDQAFYIKPNIDSTNPANTTYDRKSVPDPANYTPLPTTYAKINYSDVNGKSEGIWIQASSAEKSTTGGITAYDFYIHACWESVGLNAPMTLGTIVRIYE